MAFFSLKREFDIRRQRARNRGQPLGRKVFAVGYNKSGTTSLHVLFESLGLRSYHGTRWRSANDLQLLNEYQCFSDGIPNDLAKLDRMFPRSRFILQVRDLESWVYSRLAHIEGEKEKGTWRGDATWDATESAVKSWIGARNDYHRFVFRYFRRRPSDLLVVNYIRDPAAARKICRFLGHAPVAERPQENVNPRRRTPRRHVALLHHCARQLGLRAEELAFDIHCPSLETGPVRSDFPEDTSRKSSDSSRI